MAPIVETFRRRGCAAELLARLRAETAEEHRAIEAVLALGSDAITLDRYRAILERLHGFYVPVEEGLARDLRPWVRDVEARRKVPLLRADLQTLGASRDLPTCDALPALDDAARCFGGLYVLEGATLGGRLIAHRVHERLGLCAERGARFFSGYGERTSTMWSAFRATLVDFAERTGHDDAVVAGALATYRAMRAWCDRAGVAETTG